MKFAQMEILKAFHSERYAVRLGCAERWLATCYSSALITSLQLKYMVGIFSLMQIFFER